MEINKVYQGDSAVLLKQIPNNFIDLTVTSPPYDNLRDYKGYTFDFETIAKELYRVTKDGGVVVWVVGDATINGSETGTSFRQALFFKGCGFYLHDTMIYYKSSYLHQNCDRYQQEFEYMFVFSKGKIITFNELREQKKWMDRRKPSQRINGKKNNKNGLQSVIKIDKPRGNVWIYNVGGGHVTRDSFAHGHPAIFPEQLAKDHIISWSNEGDLVFDPFAGSGTTLKMAQLMGRNYLGFEIAEEYIPLINKRLQQKPISHFSDSSEANASLPPHKEVET